MTGAGVAGVAGVSGLSTTHSALDNVDEYTYKDWDEDVGVSFSLLEERDYERFWWRASSRKAFKPLGPGFLPVFAANRMHEESHTLVVVSITVPEIPVDPPAGSVGPSRSNSLSSLIDVDAIPTASTAAASAGEQPRPFKQPHPTEVRSAIPHPFAYYCSKCNGWVIIRGIQSHDVPIYPNYRDACPELNFPTAPRVDKKCNSSSVFSSSNS